MAKKKSRLQMVKLVSSALTGYFKVMTRPRTADKLSFLKYDPVVRRRVLLVEEKMKR